MKKTLFAIMIMSAVLISVTCCAEDLRPVRKDIDKAVTEKRDLKGVEKSAIIMLYGSPDEQSKFASPEGEKEIYIYRAAPGSNRKVMFTFLGGRVIACDYREK